MLVPRRRAVYAVAGIGDDGIMIPGRSIVMTAGALLTGCAGLQFTGPMAPNAFVYNAAVPFALVKTAADCSKTVEVLMLPGKSQGIVFRNGFGSAKLGIKLSNNMITEITQETDPKIPETITALAGAATAAAGAKTLTRGCPAVALFQIVATGDTVGFRRATDFDALLTGR